MAKTKTTVIDRIKDACEAAVEDMDHGSDHYDEPVVTVKALRKILKGADADPWGHGRNPLGCCGDRRMHGGPGCKWPGEG